MKSHNISLYKPILLHVNIKNGQLVFRFNNQSDFPSVYQKFSITNVYLIDFIIQMSEKRFVYDGNVIGLFWDVVLVADQGITTADYEVVVEDWLDY